MDFRKLSEEVRKTERNFLLMIFSIFAVYVVSYLPTVLAAQVVRI